MSGDKPKLIYMIRDRKTGDFSPGGSDALARWKDGKWAGKKGKVWSGMGPLRNHLRQFIRTEWTNHYSQRREFNDIPAEWEVLSFEVKYEEKLAMVARNLIVVPT